MESYTRVAYISSARNLDGSVVCRAADGLPFLVEVGQTVHFVPPALKAPRNARVASVSKLRSDAWEVAFEGVEDATCAEELAGCYCLVASGEVNLPSASNAPALLRGFAVRDAQFGDLGEVAQVVQTHAQDTLLIEGGQGQVLVPLVDEFVSAIDEDARCIRTHITESLLHLNMPDAKGGKR